MLMISWQYMRFRKFNTINIHAILTEPNSPSAVLLNKAVINLQYKFGYLQFLGKSIFIIHQGELIL